MVSALIELDHYECGGRVVVGLFCFKNTYMFLMTDSFLMLSETLLTSHLCCLNETKVDNVFDTKKTFGSNNLEDSYREPGEHYVPSLLISWLVKLHDLNKCSFHKNKKNNLSSTGFFPMERFKRRNIIEYIDICRGKIKNYP